MTTLDWDYSALAAHYNQRAPYAAAALDALLAALQLPDGATVADIGAGTGRLSLPLRVRGLHVTAVEPNAAMRSVGRQDGLEYVDTRGEATGLPAGGFALVSYGSSFNVLPAAAALAEAARLLMDNGAIALLWNHRDLDDPLQQRIEQAIRNRVPVYAYGSRREDPTAQIDASGLFGPVQSAQHAFVHHSPRADFIDGFRAHATLRRQAGEAFDAILRDIEMLLGAAASIAVPFHTRLWWARRRDMSCTP
jgi:SAM-dependent methyltransferase